jgi:hypothetical protein
MPKFIKEDIETTPLLKPYVEVYEDKFVVMVKDSSGFAWSLLWIDAKGLHRDCGISPDKTGLPVNGAGALIVDGKATF